MSTRTYHQKTQGRWGFVHKALHRERLLRDLRGRLYVSEMVAEQARIDAASDRQENERLRAEVARMTGIIDNAGNDAAAIIKRLEELGIVPWNDAPVKPVSEKYKP